MIFKRIRHRADRFDGSGRPREDSRRFAECENVGFRRSRASRGGFTLIELLVVLGIIAAVIGGVGLALRGGDDTVALGSAQRTMASLLTAARGQAVMNGTNARLIVHVDPSEPELYLRKVGIVRELLDGGVSYSPRRWVPTSEGTVLPRGVYFVPPTGNPALAAPGLFDEWTPGTDAFSRSGNSNPPNVPMDLQYPRTPSGQDYVEEGQGTEVRQWAFYEFRANGEMKVEAAVNPQIVLTTGRRTPSTPVLENPENVRGMVLRRIGTFHVVGERLTFHDTN